MKDSIIIHTNNHDAAGNPATKVVDLETWNNLKKLNEIYDDFFMKSVITFEEKSLHQQLITKLREAGFDKWDLRTRWQATAYERNNKLEKLLN